MPTPLKDYINPHLVEELAERFAHVHDGFDGESFIASIVDELASLELKERIGLIADRLVDHLPGDYRSSLSVVVEVAAGDIGGWAAWPLCTFVERHGLDFPALSLDAMPHLTKRASCEFAIRPFLENHLDLTREHLRRWVEDPDEAVRRLASEGTRPRLPWGPQVPALVDDPSIGIEVLTALRNDESETVRRSVANHLNDVTKSHPDLVVALMRDWLDDPEPVDLAMVRHALRTLVKNGHPGALDLLGFATEPSIEVTAFSCEPESIALGSVIELKVELVSTSPIDQGLVVDFVIHHPTPSGTLSTKVFKWTTLDLGPGETVALSKRRRIQTASTRRYTAGAHLVELQVGGKRLASATFVLTESSSDD